MSASAEPPHDRFVRIALAGAALVAGLVSFRMAGDVVDDAFITFRAAANAAHGEGLTFDPGEAPVESFSSPLLALVCVPAVAAGVPPWWLARLLGLAGLVASALGVFRIVRRAGGTEASAAVAAAATLGSFSLVTYAWNGMETTLYAGLLVLGVERWLAGGGRASTSSAMLLALAATTRPEAPLVLVLLVPLLLRHPDRARALTLAGLVALALAGGVALRFTYYGALLPNTFVAKSLGSADHDPSTSAALASLLYLGRFALSLGLVIPLAALAAPYGRDEVRVIAAPALAGLVFSLYAGGDWMPGGRYLAPYLPFVAALGALGLDALEKRGQLRRPGLGRALALGLALVGSLDLLAEATLHRREFPYHVLSSEETLAAAADMRSLLPPRARVVAFRIGALGWAGDFDVIDLLGLADREIALLARAHPDYHPQRTRMGDDLPELRALVTARDPDAVLLVTDADATFDETIHLYDLDFSFARSYPLGTDQAWALYRRERGGTP